MRQIATAVVKHIKDGKMEMPVPREIVADSTEVDANEEASGPRP
jgi:hypothetical protein